MILYIVSAHSVEFYNLNVISRLVATLVVSITYQITVLGTWNWCNIVCQLYFNNNKKTNLKK